MFNYQMVADDIPQLKRGMVWCKRCGTSERVDSAKALQIGWPACCGETMTIDSPDERSEKR